MCPINKIDQVAGRMCRHRFSCPDCGDRQVRRRRLTKLGQRITTWCTACHSRIRVWVPDFVSPS